MTTARDCAHLLAFEAAAALDAYETQLAGLGSAPADPAACARLTATLRRVCSRCMRVPQLSVACVALLLSHYRLLGEVMRRAERPTATAGLLLMQCHQACILRLQRQCRELFLAPHLH